MTVPPGRPSGDAAEPTAFDLSSTYVHLGLGATAAPLADFEWSADALAAYEAAHATDGAEGRLVVVSPATVDWTVWERHPAGDELVVVLDASVVLVQDRDGTEVRIPMEDGEAAINPRGVWHTADVRRPGRVLYVTPGMGTEHKLR